MRNRDAIHRRDAALKWHALTPDTPSWIVRDVAFYAVYWGVVDRETCQRRLAELGLTP